MLLLLKQADVYAPEHLGLRDILIAGTKILRMEERLETPAYAEVIDLGGRRVAPGYLDMHVHITGGGGEQGPSSRTPEITLSQLTKSGVTTCVGLLGTDGVTRSLPNLLSKCLALNEEGITCYMLTGAYGYPGPTFFGDIEADIMLIERCIGVKISMADHRSSSPTGEELIKVATSARRGGLLSGKAGIVCIHMGSGPEVLSRLYYAMENADLPFTTMIPTHMSRSDELIVSGIPFARQGGFLDFTGSTGASARILKALELGAPERSITLSSDGCGSMPRFDERGECVGLTYSSPIVLHNTLKDLLEAGLTLEQALPFLTTNPAAALKLPEKGRLQEGADADLIVYGDDLSLSGVFAKGQRMVWDGRCIVLGRFEEQEAVLRA